MTTYFTSDSHWFHRNIIKYSDRPFDSLEEMNEAMIERWNSRVSRSDTVYHLGDISFSRADKFAPIADRLNGIIHLLPGNHDGQDILAMSRWASVSPYREVSVDGQFTVLSHYKFAVFNKAHRGAIQLFGHSHTGRQGKPLHTLDNNQQVDVGVDCWDFYPVTMKEIK